MKGYVGLADGGVCGTRGWRDMWGKGMEGYVEKGDGGICGIRG